MTEPAATLRVELDAITKAGNLSSIVAIDKRRIRPSFGWLCARARRGEYLSRRFTARVRIVRGRSQTYTSVAVQSRSENLLSRRPRPSLKAQAPTGDPKGFQTAGVDRSPVNVMEDRNEPFGRFARRQRRTSLF